STTPFSGGLGMSLSLDMADSSEPWTLSLVTLDFMLDACPYSSRNWLVTSDICLSGGIYREMSSVPLPFLLRRPSRRRLNSYLSCAVNSILADLQNCSWIKV